MLQTHHLPPAQTRKAIRRARVVYVRTDLGLFRVSKREALKVIRLDSPTSAITVQQFLDSVCIGTDR
jgi:hypothetical protein